MRSCVFVFLTLYVLCGATLTTAAGEIPLADAVTFLGTESIGAEIMKAVFAVHVSGNPTNEGKQTWVSIGSGFFAGDNTAAFSITCKHVVDTAKKAKKELYVGLDTDKGYRRFAAKILYIDPENDIAILLAQIPLDEAKVINFQNIKFPLDQFDDGTSLVEGRGLLITGYPLSLGTEEDKNHPVVRFGMIAQNTGKSSFLIDGVASHGNSGSPVVTLKGTKYRLSGMITSFAEDRITLFDENGQISASLPYNSGLARAVRASLILKAINEAKKKL